MSPRPGRLVGAVVAALLAWGATTVMRPIPERRPGAVLGAAGAPLAARPDAPAERVDSLGRGESLLRLLSRAGLSDAEAGRAVVAASTLDPRRLPVGMRVTVAEDSSRRAARIVFRLAVDRFLHLTRSDSGWVEREERLPWTTDTVSIRGQIVSTLYDAFDQGGEVLPSAARAELAWSVADVFEYRLDMSRDLQPGDEFHVLFERASGPESSVRLGRVLAAAYRSGSTRIDATRFGDSGGRGQFFDQDGKSMRAAFLRAPLEFRRISSVFGMRKHPILGVWRAHRGTDYAASSGTLVRAVGDGVVIGARRDRGYGNVVDVRHANGYVTRYGHLRAFAPGIRRGARVSIAQTVGYVGMTGLATAPHLHFEVLVSGVQQNPRLALAAKAGTPLPAGEKDAFAATREHYMALLEQRAVEAGDSW